MSRTSKTFPVLIKATVLVVLSNNITFHLSQYQFCWKWNDFFYWFMFHCWWCFVLFYFREVVCSLSVKSVIKCFHIKRCVWLYFTSHSRRIRVRASDYRRFSQIFLGKYSQGLLNGKLFRGACISCCIYGWNPREQERISLKPLWSIVYWLELNTVNSQISLRLFGDELVN